MTLKPEILDELLSGVDCPEDLLGDQGLMKELKVRLMERTKIRLMAALAATGPVAEIKTAKVGVSLAPMVTFTWASGTGRIAAVLPG